MVDSIRKRFLVLMFFTLLFSLLFFEGASAQISSQNYSFEEAISRYGIEDSQVVGDFVFVDSEEIPYYEFTYYWKLEDVSLEEPSFFEKAWDFVKRIFVKREAMIRIPARKMSERDWRDYSNLFVLKAEDVASFHGYKKGDYSFEIEYNYSEGGLPAYTIMDKERKFVTPSGKEVPFTVVVPAVAMPGSSTEAGKELWPLWSSAILSIEKDCSEENCD